MSGSKHVDQPISISYLSGGLPGVYAVSALFLSLALLGGCVETDAAIPPAAELGRRYIAREDANLSAVKLAVMSLSGAPEEYEGRFKAAFEAETRKAQLAFVPEKADYFLRGYLSVYPSEDGTVAAVVWDVFDFHKKRAQRLADQIIIAKSSESGSWTSLNNEDWEKFAGLSAANLATFVSNTPESENKEKSAPPKLAQSTDGNAEIANSNEENSSLMNEGRTIAVKSSGGTSAPEAKIASFH